MSTLPNVDVPVRPNSLAENVCKPIASCAEYVQDVLPVNANAAEVATAPAELVLVDVVSSPMAMYAEFPAVAPVVMKDV